jgi:hypothetical protein
MDFQRCRKTLLTENGAESGKMHNIKVIENFETFLESTNTPSYNQWFRSYNHCKLGVLLLEIISGQIKLSGQVWTSRPLPKEIWKNSEYKDPRKFYILSNEG